MDDSLSDDPIEQTPEFCRIIARARREVRAKLLAEGFDTERMLGGCHLYWPALKEHLKNHYGIEWRTPAEMNPNVLFD